MKSRRPAISISTRKIVEALPLAMGANQPVFYWDSTLKGFGVKVTSTSKSYVVEAKVQGKTVRTKIDSCAVLQPNEARKRAMALLSAMHQGNNPNQAKRVGRQRGMTFLDLCQQYIDSKELTANTRRDYQRHTRLTLASWADRPFMEIGRNLVESTYLDAISRKVTRSSGEEKVLTAAQANQALRFARSVFNFAKRYRAEDGSPLLHDNPVDVLSEGRLWRRVDKRNNYIKATQLPAVWNAIWHFRENPRTLSNQTISDFLVLMLFTGLRLNEARLLQWKNIDLVEGILTIPDPKNHHPHVLPFSDYLNIFFKHRKKLAKDSVWVFPSEHQDYSKPIVEIRRFLNKTCEKSGVSFTPHDLRRSFLTYAKELPAKYGVFFTKRLANHKISDVTEGYVQISQDELRKCMQDITDYILHNTQALQTQVGMLEPPRPPSVGLRRRINLRPDEHLRVQQSIKA